MRVLRIVHDAEQPEECSKPFAIQYMSMYSGNLESTRRDYILEARVNVMIWAACLYIIKELKDRHVQDLKDAD